MADELMAKEEIRVYRQSLPNALVTVGAITILGLSLRSSNQPFAIVSHVTAFFLFPYLAMALRNRRIEVDRHRIRSFDWRGRLEVEAKLTEITVIDIGNEDESTHFKTLQGDINFDAIRSYKIWSDMSHPSPDSK